MKHFSRVLAVITIACAGTSGASAQSASPAVTHYLAAQSALAAGNTTAAAEALAALAGASTSTTVVSRARAAARDTDLASIRRAFRDISMDATQWALPDDVVIFYCADTFEGRGAFWLQRAGTVSNPYDQGSACGTETAVGRLGQETSVIGYLDTYSRPESYSATRLNAPLRDIPLSVTPLTRDLIDDRNAVDVNDALRSTSTTTPLTGFNIRPNFYLVRGFVALSYRDGIRTLLDGSAPVNSFGLDGVEVLRGPSSILYGKGDPGGLVNFTSKRPLAVRTGIVAVNAGSDGLLRGDVDLSVPLGSSGAAGRLIVSGYQSDSYRDSVSSDVLHINPSVSFRLGTRASVWLNGEYVRYNYVPDFGVLVRHDGVVPSFFTRRRYMGDASLAKARMTGYRGSAAVDITMRSNWDMRLVAGSEVADQKDQLSFMNLIDGALAGYQGTIAANTLLRVSFDESPRRRYDYGRAENFFRFAHGAGATRATHQLLLTADYRRDHEDLDTTVTDHDLFSYVDASTSKLLLGFLPLGQGLIYKFIQTTDATQTDYGLAVQDLIAIGDRFNVLAGLRFEVNHIDSVRKGTEQISAAVGGPVVSLDAAPPTSKTSSVAPRVGVVFKPTSRLSLFASYLTAFFSPVPGALTQAGATLDAEHSRQLEGGVKVTLRDERIFLTASGYKTTKDDAFIFYPTYAENEGREESSGVEVELMGDLTPEVSVLAGYTFTDMKFTKSSPALQGKTRPGMPRHAFASWLRYQPGQVRGLSVGAGVTATGDTWASYPNTATLPGVTTIDAMVGYERQQWRLQVNGSNLTDALGYSPSGGFFAGTDPNVNPMSAMPIAGRRLTTHLSFRF